MELNRRGFFATLIASSLAKWFPTKTRITPERQFRTFDQVVDGYRTYSSDLASMPNGVVFKGITAEEFDEIWPR